MFIAKRAAVSATCLLKLTTTLSQSPLSTCFQTSSLLSFYSVFSDSSVSLIPTLNSYLGDVCPASVCSDSEITSAVDELKDDCSGLLTTFGVTADTIDSYVPYLPEVKNTVCLEDSSNDNAYCTIELMQSFQEVLGQNITYSLLESVASGSTTIDSLMSSADSSANLTEKFCTDCSKAVYNSLVTLSADTASISNSSSTGLTSQLTSYLSTLCGSTFVDGSSVSSVSNGTDTSSVVSDTSASTTSDASPSFVKLNAVGLVAVVGGLGAFFL